MQIISGIAKGMQLEVAKGFKTRPTTVRARKALFDSISEFTGLVIIDLFAGAGSLGFEAASRGATKVAFVELDPLHCKILKKNVNAFKKISNHCEFRILNMDTNKYVESNAEKADFIFSDPPYVDSLTYYKKVVNLEKFYLRQPKNSSLIWEIPANEKNLYDFLNTGLWRKSNIRAFGGIKFLIISHN